MSALLLRAARAPSCAFIRASAVGVISTRSLAARATPAAVPSLLATGTTTACGFSTTSRMRSDDSHEETFEEFSQRFQKEFEAVNDVFDLQRNLNNCFAYDLVPSVEVITAAIHAARRVNDFPTAVRIFEALRDKTENKKQYEEYLEKLKPLRDEYSILTKEELYPEGTK